MIKSKQRERQTIEQEHQLKFRKKIGQGSFGKVYEAFDIKANELVAIKKVSRKYFKLEQYFLSTLEHPNIVPFKKVIEGPKAIYLVMQLMEGGSLRSLVSRRKRDGNPLSDEEVAIIMRQILSAVEYMHDRSIIHRDLKSENILFEVKGDINSVRIVDFGLSFQFQEDNSSYKLTTGRCGTFHFMAPELLQRQQYSKPVDIWACGIIMHILLTGGLHPFASPGETREQYIEELKVRTLKVDIGYSALDLLKRLLTINPFDRYSAGQALIHPWVSRRFTDTAPMNTGETRQLFATCIKFTQIIKALMMIEQVKSSARQRQQCRDITLWHSQPNLRVPSPIDEVLEHEFEVQPQKTGIKNGFKMRFVTSPQIKRMTHLSNTVNPSSPHIFRQTSYARTGERIINLRRSFDNQATTLTNNKLFTIKNSPTKPKTQLPLPPLRSTSKYFA